MSRVARPHPSPVHLLAEDPFRVLVRLAAPTTGVMSVAALSNVLNTYFISILGSEAIAAVALVFPIGLIMSTVMAGGIGSGVASAVARSLGANRPADGVAVVEHAFVLAGILGAAMSVILVLLAPAIFRAMGAHGAVLDGAVAFGRVLFGGLVLSFFVATCDSVMRGEGNVKVPAFWSSVSLLLQIGLTPLYMFALGFGIAGAPAAMLTGQLITSGPRMRYVFGRGARLRPRSMPRRLRAAPLRDILRVGVPASLGTFTNYAGMIVLTIVLARLGTAHLAAFGLGTRLDFILLTLTYGTGVAVLTLVGFATGAGRIHLVTTYTRRAMALVGGAIAVLAALLWLYPEIWLGLFTKDPDIIAVGASYFRIVGPTYPLIGCSMVFAMAFQGLGRATTPLAIVTLRVLIVTAGAVLLTSWLGYADRAVFALIAAGNCLSAALLFYRFAGSVRAVSAARGPESASTRYRGGELKV